MSAAEVTAFADQDLRRACEDALRDVAPNAEIAAGHFDADQTAGRHWALAVELGWTAALVPEIDGGLGLDDAHVADICEAMGQTLFCGPFTETAVLVPALAREAPDIFAALQADVAAGRARVGYGEAAATRNGATLVFQPVEHAAAATHILHLDHSADGGLRVTLAPGSAFVVEMLQPLDPTASVGRVTVAGAALVESCVLTPGQAGRVLAPLHIAIAADLLGTGEAALARAVEHARTRRQFGQPIGFFQGIKHRLADCRTALTGARLAIARAARERADPGTAQLARILAADAASTATATALRTLGGAGFSWEVDLHLYMKRARRLSARNGGTTALRRMATDDFIDSVA